MNIYVAQPFSHKTVALNKREYLFVFRRCYHRKGFQKRKYGRAVPKIPTSKLTYDKRMTCDLSIIEQVRELGVHPSQMRDPYGCINKNHSTRHPSSVSA